MADTVERFEKGAWVRFVDDDGEVSFGTVVRQMRRTVTVATFLWIDLATDEAPHVEDVEVTTADCSLLDKGAP